MNSGLLFSSIALSYRSSGRPRTKTRMHSSRMCTGCYSGRLEGGGVCQGGGARCLPREGSAQGCLPYSRKLSVAYIILQVLFTLTCDLDLTNDR